VRTDARAPHTQHAGVARRSVGRQGIPEALRPLCQDKEVVAAASFEQTMAESTGRPAAMTILLIVARTRRHGLRGLDACRSSAANGISAGGRATSFRRGAPSDVGEIERIASEVDAPL